ncbi:MAG TPA: hypothetical protein VFS47_03645 [Steroidobacteraceae bacterium]|nr:hypothetical protein [Steroidobacteraceae bacterium]
MGNSISDAMGPDAALRELDKKISKQLNDGLSGYAAENSAAVNAYAASLGYEMENSASLQAYADGMTVPNVGIEDSPVYESARRLTPDERRNWRSITAMESDTREIIAGVPNGSVGVYAVDDSGIYGYNRNQEPIYNAGTVVAHGQLHPAADSSGMYFSNAQALPGVTYSPYEDEAGLRVWGFDLNGETNYVQMLPPGEAGGAGALEPAFAGALGGVGAMRYAAYAPEFRTALTTIRALTVESPGAWVGAGLAIGGSYLYSQYGGSWGRTSFVTDGPAQPDVHVNPMQDDVGQWATPFPAGPGIDLPPLIATPNNGAAGAWTTEFPNWGGQLPTIMSTPVDQGVDPGTVMLNTSDPLLTRYLEGAGGRWGGNSTRIQNDEIASQYVKANPGAVVTGGAGRAPEEWIPGPGGTLIGGTFVDITIRNGSSTTRIQTVTTLADGVTLTPAEAAAAQRIRTSFPNDQLILIPKVKRK